MPLYERPYVWKRDIEDPSEDRLTPFWEDVRDTISRYLKRQEHLAQGVDEHDLVAFADHFSGAVVLDKPDKLLGGALTGRALRTQRDELQPGVRIHPQRPRPSATADRRRKDTGLGVRPESVVGAVSRREL